MLVVLAQAYLLTENNIFASPTWHRVHLVIALDGVVMALNATREESKERVIERVSILANIEVVQRSEALKHRHVAVFQVVLNWLVIVFTVIVSSGNHLFECGFLIPILILFFSGASLSLASVEGHLNLSWVWVQDISSHCHVRPQRALVSL
jgi:hypothetical protein